MESDQIIMESLQAIIRKGKMGFDTKRVKTVTEKRKQLNIQAN